MYRRPKFLEVLLEIRRDMALEADYDVDLFAEIARSGIRAPKVKVSMADRANSDSSKESEVPRLIGSRD